MSIIRDKSLLVFQKVDKMANKYIQHQSIRWFVDKLLRPRIENLIRNTIPENELKSAMTEVFYEIKPIVDDFQISHLLHEAKKLNSTEMTRKLMKLPDFEKYEELLNDVM